MAEKMTGGCACGRVRYTASINDDEAYICHCRMCQRATGSVSIAFKNVKQADVAWEHQPDWYESSPIAQAALLPGVRNLVRIPVQGGQQEHGPDGRELRRSVAVQADAPFRRGEHPPRMAQYRRAEGNRTDEYQKLVDKWIDATGDFPG